jgi:hypothetical protein
MGNSQTPGSTKRELLRLRITPGGPAEELTRSHHDNVRFHMLIFFVSNHDVHFKEPVTRLLNC